MQVLKGKFKGKKLKVSPGVRPVSQRVKESCFAIMADEIKSKVVLDLYAGSGSLGIEALSAGAAKVVFVDKSKAGIGSIYANLGNLKLEKEVRVCRQESFSAVKYFYQKKIIFDIIFIDPPYYKGLLTKTLQLLESYDILTRSGYLIGFCYKKDNYAKDYGHFSLIVKRNYGQSTLLIYHKQ